MFVSRPNKLHHQPAARTAVEAPCDNDLRVPYFCEENVWRLCYRKMLEQPDSHFFAVFISNSKQCVPMFHQHAASNPRKPCCWDYHVILLCASRNGEVFVHDIDSTLPYPTPLRTYLELSFLQDETSQFAPLFRVIPGQVYVREFASDRSHMYNAETDSWNAAPPTYDCINMSHGRQSTFKQFNDFAHDNVRKQDPIIYGAIITKKELEEYVCIGVEDKK
jgi:hypothetical protein